MLNLHLEEKPSRDGAEWQGRGCLNRKCGVWNEEGQRKC